MAKRGRKPKKNSIYKIYGAILIMLALIILLHDQMGFLGGWLHHLSKFLFGDHYWVIYLLQIALGVYMIWTSQKPSFVSGKLIGVLCLVTAFLLVMSTPENKETGLNAIKLFYGNAGEIIKGDGKGYGGCIAMLLYGLITGLLSYVGLIIFVVILAVVGIMLLIDFNKISTFFMKIKTSLAKDQVERQKTKKDKEKQKKQLESVNAEKEKLKAERKAEKAAEHKQLSFLFGNKEEKTKEPVKEEKKAEPKINVYQPKPVAEPVEPQPEETATVVSAGLADNSKYKIPSLSLIRSSSITYNNSNRDNAKVKAEQLIDLLDQFDVPCELGEIQVGPSVTKIEVKPQSGIKVSKISSLADDIKMGLAVTDVRIEAPVPGKSVVGIEIPNVERNNVSIYELLSNVSDKLKNEKLLIALGKNLEGENVFAQIDKMPHVLIAGSTGSGKSVCINSIIMSLLLRTTPSEVKLLLIDPKKVEFTPYENLPN